MKRAVLAAAIFALVASAAAESTINPASSFSWAGNIGELNWRPALAHGVVTGEYVCSGMVWAANAGWVDLGTSAQTGNVSVRRHGTPPGISLLPERQTF